jgi:hypothetical protein
VILSVAHYRHDSLEFLLFAFGRTWREAVMVRHEILSQLQADHAIDVTVSASSIGFPFFNAAHNSKLTLMH